MCVDCTGPNNAYVEEKYVQNYMKGNVYDPEHGWSVSTIACAAPVVVKVCADVTCANGGTCEDTMSGFKCHCIFGHYNGSMCENDKIPCTAVKCLNGATCRDTDVGVGHVCECVAGYTGDTCETDIDECADNPCHSVYNVSCEDKVNDFKCECHTCSCSNVTVKKDCTLDSLTTGKALAACKEANEAHKGESDYRIAHPYLCTKYIWCYSGGLNGDEMDCGTGTFNPAYTDPNHPCKESVPECIQT
ncbi:hypothetical protein NP493_5118g00007 [Ridgeia piscesae]|uniref:EGF-like domain-containing protein n=1 Tax=Ridgeia piscesae TaxID=27915 RepID=A0AAD9MSV7_RIDPI|nr:hypothetical protein NP493_5118g00007 [Ridgeia piscesae]